MPGTVVIREAVAEDLHTVISLLCLADERNYAYEPVARALAGLDPEAIRVWLAFAGERPVGLSIAHLRLLCWDGGTHAVAYWGNLYVHPDFRSELLYPRLVLAMCSGIKLLGRELLYAAIRRPDVARGHLKLGFQQIEEIPVLAQPLRPGGLLVKLRRLPRWLAALAVPLDWLYRTYRRLRRPGVPANCVLEQVPWDSPELEQLVCLWDVPGKKLVRQAWTADGLRRRYQVSKDGVPYELLGVRRSGIFVAAVIIREAFRAPDIRLGIIMDAVAAPGEEAALASALRETERRFFQRSCDLVLFLDGLGEEMRQVMRQFGYIKTAERYVLMRHARGEKDRAKCRGQTGEWRFAFGDHDAF